MRPNFEISFAVALTTLAIGCQESGHVNQAQPASPSVPVDGESLSDAASSDLKTARDGFVTALVRRGPAPQEFTAIAPPAGVKAVTYRSGDLQLAAWISKEPRHSGPRPAVVYLHGGWAFGPADWEDATPFIDAGFVLMMPMLRAENGNPGTYEGFLGEVDDAIAAGAYVASLPYVDPDNVFLAGHSVGAVLATLSAMMPSDYRAAAALSGNMEFHDWVNAWPSAIAFDPRDTSEVRLRNPMEYPGSLRIPLILYAERGSWAEENNPAFQLLAKNAGKHCDLVITDGDHATMVGPSIQHAINWFRRHSADASD